MALLPDRCRHCFNVKRPSAANECAVAANTDAEFAESAVNADTAAESTAKANPSAATSIISSDVDAPTTAVMSTPPVAVTGSAVDATSVKQP